MTLLLEHQASIDRVRFWGALSIYIEKPHIINRRICGINNLWAGLFRQTLSKEFLHEIIKNINKEQGLSKTTFNIQDIILTQDSDNNYETSNIYEDEKEFSQSFMDLAIEAAGVLILIRKLIPKDLNRYTSLIEIIVCDFQKDTATFIAEDSSGSRLIPSFNYSIEFVDDSIILKQISLDNTDTDENRDCLLSSKNYLCATVIPKIHKWANNYDKNATFKGSLQLVDINCYNELYQELKAKYGKLLVETWPETTDPLKYVYEDIAIATYLILIWRKEVQLKSLKQQQSFIDLGCGNGLLVFILNNEGYPGTGCDLKRRKIWDLYPTKVDLQEKIIEPSDRHLLPEYDWLIGNHSDELTPWIPVIAAKSSYKTSFFVIPCCPHDFENKYLRTGSNKSQYAEYLDYVEEIAQTCGFKVEKDKLRIPSTKRVCFIGNERTYLASEASSIFSNIDDFIKINCKRYKKSNELQQPVHEDEVTKSTDMWSDNFKHRIVDQPVRNCTMLNPEFKEELVLKIAYFILRKKQLVEVNVGEQTTKQWNIGGLTDLSMIASELDATQLKILKKECGGLQTLLKNYNNIFHVNKGKVQLRVPKTIRDVKSTNLLHSKPCWFHFNHPQKCIWESDNCAYSH